MIVHLNKQETATILDALAAQPLARVYDLFNRLVSQDRAEPAPETSPQQPAADDAAPAD